jgi:hypothetical protein
MYSTAAVRTLVRDEIQPRWAAQLRNSDDWQADEVGDASGNRRSGDHVRDGGV